jgi:hypothetical protein
MLLPLNELAGLSLAEAFRRYVLEDPEVVAAGEALADHRGVFSEGHYPALTVSYLWPTCFKVSELASAFASTIWFLDEPIPKPLEAHVRAAEVFTDRWGAICTLLQGGALVGKGCFNASGCEEVIVPAQWSRPSGLVDVRNGDLLEGPRHQALVRWTGIVLSARPMNPKRVDAVPTRATQRAVTTIAARNACKEWLAGHMRSSPLEKIASKNVWWQKAQEKWPGSLSRDAFDIVWSEAARATEAFAWIAAGALKKSSRRNQSLE